MQLYSLRKTYQVSTLERRLKENGNKLSFTDSPGIPPTIFDRKISAEIVTLKFTECKVLKHDFKDFSLLISLTKLSIIKCRLKSIPNDILKIKLLKELNLSGNFITKVDASIAKLKNLTTLDLSNNNLETIEPQFENLTHLLTVDLSGNSKLQMKALKAVLACKSLRFFYSPGHFIKRKKELNPWERTKFDAVIAWSGNFVVPYSSEDSPHIPLGDREKMYKMNSFPKGIALIINHHSYRHFYGNQTGRKEDVAMLQSVLQKIGFDTVCCRDKTANGATEFVKKYAKEEKYKDCDCIVVVVISDGSESGLTFSDDNTLDVMRLVELVQESTIYQEKPKLFFIQACGVDSVTHGVVETVPSVHGNGERKTTDALLALDKLTELPPDILLSYSTIQSFSSFRGLTYGSWYVQALVETLCEHAWDEDILSLLNLVSEKVHRKSFEFLRVSNPRNTLRKKLYLLPGYSSRGVARRGAEGPAPIGKNRGPCCKEVFKL